MKKIYEDIYKDEDGNWNREQVYQTDNGPFVVAPLEINSSNLYLDYSVKYKRIGSKMQATVLGSVLETSNKVYFDLPEGLRLDLNKNRFVVAGPDSLHLSTDHCRGSINDENPLLFSVEADNPYRIYFEHIDQDLLLINQEFRIELDVEIFDWNPSSFILPTEYSFDTDDWRIDETTIGNQKIIKVTHIATGKTTELDLTNSPHNPAVVVDVLKLLITNQIKGTK